MFSLRSLVMLFTKYCYSLSQTKYPPILFHFLVDIITEFQLISKTFIPNQTFRPLDNEIMRVFFSCAVILCYKTHIQCLGLAVFRNSCFYWICFLYETNQKHELQCLKKKMLSVHQFDFQSLTTHLHNYDTPL